MRDPKTALDTHAREELGIDPDEGLGSPWGAAISSFVMFAFGAFLPLIPFFFRGGSGAVVAAAAIAAVSLLTVGALDVVAHGAQPGLLGAAAADDRRAGGGRHLRDRAAGRRLGSSLTLEARPERSAMRTPVRLAPTRAAALSCPSGPFRLTVPPDRADVAVSRGGTEVSTCPMDPLQARTTTRVVDPPYLYPGLPVHRPARARPPARGAAAIADRGDRTAARRGAGRRARPRPDAPARRRAARASGSSCTAACSTATAGRCRNTLVEVWQANAGGRYAPRRRPALRRRSTRTSPASAAA